PVIASAGSRPVAPLTASARQLPLPGLPGRSRESSCRAFLSVGQAAPNPPRPSEATAGSAATFPRPSILMQDDDTMSLNRNQRAQMAQETVRIIGHGYYLSPTGRRVDIGSAVVASAAGTLEFPPDHVVPLPHDLHGRHTTEIVVQNETTLAAARRLRADHRTI